MEGCQEIRGIVDKLSSVAEKINIDTIPNQLTGITSSLIV